MESKIMINRKFLGFMALNLSVNIYGQASSYCNLSNVEIPKDLCDTPSSSHLFSFLGALKSIVSYCYANQDEINLELVIGLVLMNVNLKSALQENGLLLQRELRGKATIEEMIQFNDGIVSQFYKELSVTKDDFNEIDYLYKSISNLFIKDSLWLKRLPSFKTNRVSYYSGSEAFDEAWPDWNEYLNEVNDVDTKIPNRKQSDLCLASISDISTSRKHRSHCHGIQRSCYQIIYSGTDFGYPLAHRLLMLTTANIGRGCSIFSRDEDEYLVKQMCARAIDETGYIADRGLILGDLVLEFIAICTLNGNSQILRLSWLRNLLLLQTPRGCFTPTITAVTDVPGNGVKIQDGGEGTCNTHTTGVAAAAFGAAVRFIVELD